VTAVADAGAAREAHRGATPSEVAVSAQVTGAEWDAYVSGHPERTVDHLWGWRSIFERVFGQECVYLVARRSGGLAGVLPLVRFRSRLFGRFVTSVPFLNYGGLLADDDVAARGLLAHAKTEAAAFGATHLELRHQRRVFADLPYRQHKLAFVRPLPPTVEALWAETDRKVRNQVRKAQKEGLTAECGGSELVPAFYRVFGENMRDLGTPVYPQRLFEETCLVFPDRTQVFVVRQGVKTLGGAVAIRLADTLLVPWASSLRAYRHLCPNMLLYWTMLDRATTDGVRTFDFGRSSPGAGTHQFKLQWGAVATPLSWEYVMLSGQAVPDHGPSNPRFRLAIDAWKRLPLAVANRLGPPLARHLP
jgi:FemAB-related protein (PEP-CTERM system-associated)